MASLLFVTTDQIVQILIFVVVLAVVWGIMKAILRFTMRMFAFGCGALVLLGVFLVILRFVQ